METLNNLAFGLGVALSWQNILYCFIGCFLGTLVGVLPGIGPVATVAMLLPFTFGLEPAPALIMLAGIYYGAQYGGSTTAILVNLPGESSSVVTCIDGYQMGKQGRAGPALAIAALGSFFAGCVGTVLIALFGPPLAESLLELLLLFGQLLNLTMQLAADLLGLFHLAVQFAGPRFGRQDIAFGLEGLFVATGGLGPGGLGGHSGLL